MPNLLLRALLPLTLLTGHALADYPPAEPRLLIHELELTGDMAELAWDSELALDRLHDGLLLTFTGEHLQGETAAIEVQVLKTYALTPGWDFTAGWRGDLRPDPQRHWLTTAVSGTAPGAIDTALSLYLGSGGRSNLTIELAREFSPSATLRLVPDLEVNFYAQDDNATGTQGGLTDVTAGLRLFYAWLPAIEPYVGVTRTRLLGDTARNTQAGGEPTDETHFLAGLSARF